MENIFSQFSGANLDRLVACIQKVREEGLTLDQYCQAGINQSSGNVYIWSEDWSGCVYCSLGGNVFWSYSCPECGEEYDFPTEEDCSKYAFEHEGRCEACNADEE